LVAEEVEAVVRVVRAAEEGVGAVVLGVPVVLLGDCYKPYDDLRY
jgi:hypothetical protein